MTKPVWRVEFDQAAVRDLRKLGSDAERRVLPYLRERIANSKDPAVTVTLWAIALDSGAIGSVITESLQLSRTIASWCWLSRSDTGGKSIARFELIHCSRLL